MDDDVERVSEEERRAAAERIEAARASTEQLVASLTRLWHGTVEASDMTNIDDEHDPEGATVAFERAQLRDSLTRARADLEELNRAAERLRTGEYWVCERCGGPVPPARLEARPATSTCVACAAKT